MSRLRKYTAIGLLVLSVSWPVTLWGDRPTDAAAQEREELDARITKLIEQLGDTQYHVREKAQEELRRLGSVAFDALLGAQENDDVEIAMRARYLVRSLPIAWARDTDPPELKPLFRDYSDQERGERLTRAKHFATFEDPAASLALCRIMRFDPDRILSKHAAVLLLKSPWPETDELRRQRAELIRQEVALSKRPGALWLQVYARSLAAPTATLADWDRIAKAELETLAKEPQQTDRELVRELFRWQAQLLLQVGREDDALACIRRTFDLIAEDRKDLYDVLDWSVEHNLHRVADELAQHFAAQFQEDPHLLYRLAESQLKRGQEEVAHTTAEQARGLAPKNLQQHSEIAVVLRVRMLTDWSEREFGYVIEQTKADEPQGAKARWVLAEMLFDWQREREAAELAQAVAEAGARNPQVFEMIFYDASHVQGYMNYYFAMHFARAQDRDKQIEHLRKAINDYPSNPDFLIAMHRVPQPDDAWKREVKQRIEAMAGELRQQIKASEATLQQPINDDDRRDYESDLANKYNEFAWLISNTEGDLQEALRASQRSLELEPDKEPFLDTLGRCYYSIGDYENAVRVQSRAVKRMPYLQVMRRQLELFEKALADSKGAADAPPKKEPGTDARQPADSNHPS